MAEYIKREAAIDACFNGWNNDAHDCAENIRLIPAADVRENKRGRWKDAMQSCHDSPHVKCSVCGEYYWRYFKKFNYCPNCGADMREES